MTERIYTRDRQDGLERLKKAARRRIRTTYPIMAATQSVDGTSCPNRLQVEHQQDRCDQGTHRNGGVLRNRPNVPDAQRSQAGPGPVRGQQGDGDQVGARPEEDDTCRGRTHDDPDGAEEPSTSCSVGRATFPGHQLDEPQHERQGAEENVDNDVRRVRPRVLDERASVRQQLHPVLPVRHFRHRRTTMHVPEVLVANHDFRHTISLDPR